jgi:hypothetical protein
MPQKPSSQGLWAPIISEETAREAVKMGGLPILALGASVIVLARTGFTATTIHLAVILAYLIVGLIFIVFAFRIRKGRAASLPYLVAIFFCFSIAELFFAFVFSAGSVGEGWAEISVILTHIVTFIAAFLAIKGLRGWWYLRKAGVPMRF